MSIDRICDLDLDLYSDLATFNGDLKVIKGTDLIDKSLVRRLGTETLTYSKMIRTNSGIKRLDADYFNEAVNYLASPKSQVSPLINKALVKCLSKDERISLFSVSLDKQAANSDEILVNVVYGINGDRVEASLKVSKDGN